MKIIQTEHPYNGDLDYEGSLEIAIETNESNMEVSFGKGEPEDFCLARDLNDAYRICDMLQLAYNAGKNGESIETIYKEEEE